MTQFAERCIKLLRQAVKRASSLILGWLSSRGNSSHRRLYLRSLKVLCIVREDIADIVRLFLETEGVHQLTTVLDGQKGLELARIEKPDVVILDELVSGMDGFKVYTVMKEDVNLRHIPTVFLESGQAPPPLIRVTQKSVLPRALIDPKQLIEAVEWATTASITSSSIQ